MKYRNPTYFLGTIIDGREYMYTGLGFFKTARAAAERCREKRAIVFEQYEAFSERGQPVGLGPWVPVAQCLGG